MLMAIIAFSIVFLVIIGLMLLMMGLKHFVGMMNQEAADAPGEKTSPSAPAKKPEAASSKASPATAYSATASSPSADDELTAVIAAAITAATGAAARVLSFAPSQPGEIRTGHITPAWRMTSILSNSRGLRDCD